MVNYQNIIKQPFKDMKSLGIAILLYVIPFISMFTGFFVMGYALRLAGNVMYKKYEMPLWADLWTMWTKGVLATLINLIYFIPGFVLVFLGAKQYIFDFMFKGVLSVDILINWWLVGSALLLIIIATYIIPAAMMFFVKEDSFLAAFKLKDIFLKSFTKSYMIVWLFVVLFSITVGLIASVISALLSFSTFLPLVIISIGEVIVIFVLMTAFGEVFQK